MQTKAKALSALSATAFIWAFNAIILKFLLAYGNVISFTIIRFLLSSLTIFVFLAFTKKLRLPTLIHLKKLAMLGFFSITLTNTAMMLGLEYSTVSNLGIFNATLPFFIAMISLVFYKQSLLIIQYIGIAVILISTLYILTDGQLSAVLNMTFNRGDIIFICSQVGWALYTIESAKLLREISLAELVAWAGLFGVCLNLVIGFCTGQLEMPQFNTEVVLALIYSVWISAVPGMLLWNYGVKNLGPSIAGVFINLSTVITICLGVAIYGEPLRLSIIFGTLGIFVGIALIVNYRTLQKVYKSYKIRKRLSHIKYVSKH